MSLSSRRPVLERTGALICTVFWGWGRADKTQGLDSKARTQRHSQGKDELEITPISQEIAKIIANEWKKKKNCNKK